MIKKKCTKCGLVKSLNNYHKSCKESDGRVDQCKNCRSAYAKQYHKDGRASMKFWNEEKKAKHRKQNNQWYKANKEKCLKSCQKYKELHLQQWKETKRRSIRKARQNINKKISDAISNGIWWGLRQNKNGKHWESLVGYTLGVLKKHLEKQFVNGMSWKNYGKWHIDHIIPQSFFVFVSPKDVEFQMCWRLENLQPLWAKDNLSKHNKVKLVG